MINGNLVTGDVILSDILASGVQSTGDYSCTMVNDIEQTCQSTMIHR